MSLNEPEAPSQFQSSQHASIEKLSDAMAIATIQDDPLNSTQLDPQNQPPEALSIQTYSRTDLLRLRNSPLVRPPSNMPDLKDWFGTENEHAMVKKESESSASSNIRERRFRRDLEDGDPSRPAYRTSQPSQMGNFKHQSIRSGDRDRDHNRDSEKDRERDIRDKEGQERLRNLSDKYDRDRLTHPLPLRKQDRDSAPHLSASGTSRHSSQSQSSLTPGRANPRELTKKKPGEASEDWRRGADISRPAKDESREDRERPRSGPRDSSRSRREPSASRRDREDRDRERERRGERDVRKDKEEYRRDRDNDDHEDTRRWRDDGKREERMAARRVERDRELRERTRDRSSNDSAWDISDRRWTPGEDRAKRLPPRERKADDKDREERREAQKEKEPAWMDAYIPTNGSGILGGKLPDGELDGIQAWKKGMKEREEREKASSNQNGDDAVPETKPPQADPQAKLDEIQLFKMLMKQEEAKKQRENADVPTSGTSTPFGEPRSKNDLLTAEEAFHNNPGSLGFIDGRVTHQPISAKRSTQPSPATDTPIPLVESHELSPDTSKSRLFTQPVGHGAASVADRIPNNLSPNQYTPPSASRLLAFARSSGPSGQPNARATKDTQLPVGPAADGPRSTSGFTPFEEHARQLHSLEEVGRNELSVNPALDGYQDGPEPGAYGANKGSRFAKFFDGKSKEPPSMNKGPTPTGFASTSPNPIHRPDQAGYSTSIPPAPAERTVDDIVAMLNNSAQRGIGGTNIVHPNFQSGQPGAHLLQHQNQLPTHPHPFNQQLHPSGRLDSLYESREDRSFVPDGMVPGLRPVPPRGRDNIGMYNDDDLVVHNPPRLPNQHRNVEPLYSGPSPALFAQSAMRNNGIPMQQPQFRGGPSPISNLSAQQLPLQTLQNQQRLPPGLANLGGRPAHEPNQFLGMPGMPGAGLVHPNGSNQQQPPFNNFPPSNGLGFGGPQQQVRAPMPAGHLPNPAAHLGLGGIAHPNNLEMRNPSHQGPLLNLVNANAAGLRGPFPPQPGPGPQLQPPLLGLRQQQQQLHPHMMPHLLPPHFQQSINNAAPQPAQDLMALLMGGPHRE